MTRGKGIQCECFRWKLGTTFSIGGIRPEIRRSSVKKVKISLKYVFMSDSWNETYFHSWMEYQFVLFEAYHIHVNKNEIKHWQIKFIIELHATASLDS